MGTLRQVMEMHDEIDRLKARVKKLRSERDKARASEKAEVTRWRCVSDRAERADAEVARLNSKVEELTALLREWIATPFFEDEDRWRSWVNKFKPRVEAAIDIVDKKE